MNGKLKRILAVAVVCAMAFAIAACGGSGGGSTTTATTAAAAAATTAATTAAVGDTEATTAAADTAATTAADTAATTAAAEDGGADEELYVIEHFNTYANYMGVTAGWFGKLLKDKFNIEMNIISPNVAGTGDQLYQTRTAAGNLGDSIVISMPRVIDLQAAGLVLDMRPQLDNYPNLQKLSTAYEAFSTSFPDGGVYGIPGRVSSQEGTVPAGRGLNPEVAPYIRYDWYLELGQPEMNGWDGMLDVLAQMIELHPTNEAGDKNYAFSLFPDWDGNSVRAAHEMLLMEGYINGNGYIWMNSTDKTTTSITDPTGPYYEHLKILFKANSMGILDPDSATQNWDMVASKVRTEKRVAFTWWPFLGDSVFARIDLATRAPFAPLPVEGMKLNSPGYNPFGMEGNAYAIGSGAKYPERIMELYDWFASPEGILAVNGLIEGVTYEMVDGKPALTDFALDSNPDKVAPESMGGGDWDDGGSDMNYPLTHQDDPNELLNGASVNSSLWESTIALNSNEYNTAWAEHFGSDNPMRYFMDNGYMIVTPATDYTPPSEPPNITTIRAQIKEIIQPAGWQMIYASSEDEFESIWNNALAQLDDFGLQELLDYDMQITQAKLARIAELGY